MPMQQLSVNQARQLFLQAQALRLKQRPWSGLAGLLDCVKHLGYIQIDTISAVARAHHHVLWSRVNGYSAGLLDRAQAQDRTIFEYWSHAAAFLPMQDFRYSIPRHRAFYDKYHKKWSADTLKVHQFVLDRIRAEGALSAREFEAPPDWQSGNWFDWKPAKQALERLFHCGDLMISKRIGFQKVFDLPERVVPQHCDTSLPGLLEEARHLIRTQLNAQGLACLAEIGYLRGRMRIALKQTLADMLEEGEIVEVAVAGIDDRYYLQPHLLEQRPRQSTHKRLQILSPFDNSVIQRRKLSRFFNYDYTIECYVPEPKRQFGYFCLPLLYRSQFIGRLDAKAERKYGRLNVKSLWIEHSERTDHDLAESLAAAIREFALFNNCTDIEIQHVSDKKLKSALVQLLKA